MSTLLQDIEAHIAAARSATLRTNVGVIRELGDGVARVEGLSDVMLNEMLDLGHGVTGLALSLDDADVGVIILGDDTRLQEGGEVRATGKLLQVPVGKGLLGRVVNTLGQPLDGKGPIAGDDFYPVEKAGIIKRGVPVVVGPLDPEAAGAVEAIAIERGAEIVRATACDADGFTVGLAGAHQRVNAGVAVRLLEAANARGIAVPREAIAAGLADPRWPGRLDRRRLSDGRELLLDAAHNPAGAVALASYLKADGRGPRPLVFAAMRDKHVGEMLEVLLPEVSRLVVTAASTPRSAEPEAIAAIARELSPALAIDVEPGVAAALDRAWRASPDIVVAGSIFLLGDVLKLINRT